MRPHVFAAIALAVWLDVGGGSEVRATASDGDDPKTRAGELVRAGNEFYSKHEYSAALALFERAVAVYPSAMIYYNIARTHQVLGDLLRAARFYQKFLDGSGTGAGSERRRLSLEALKEIDRRVGKLALRGAPEGAEIKVDGAPLEDPASLPLVRVIAGEHEIEATLPKRRPFHAVAQVAPGETSTIEIVLEEEIEPAAAAAPPAPQLVPGVETTPNEGSASIVGEWWFWTLIAGAAIAAGATVAVVARGGHFTRNGELDTTSTKHWESF
jgi:hypothetical protein